MRRYLDWLGGALWGVAVYRLWKRWQGGDAETWPEPESAVEADDRAEELRAKLAETRGAEQPSPLPAEPDRPETPEERRRRVHEEGRAAVDEMRGGE